VNSGLGRGKTARLGSGWSGLAMTGRVCRSAFRGMAAVACSPGPRSSVRRRRWQARWPGSGPAGWLARSRRARPASWPAYAEWRSCWCGACRTRSLFHDVGVEGDAVEDGGDEAGVGKDGAEAIQSTTRPRITDRHAVFQVEVANLLAAGKAPGLSFDEGVSFGSLDRSAVRPAGIVQRSTCVRLAVSAVTAGSPPF
jgi:hypothetical protein